MSLPVTQTIQVEDDDGPEEGEIEDDEDEIVLVETSPQPSSATSTSLDVYPSPGRKESYERDIRNFELRRARAARVRRASGGSKTPYIINPSVHGNDSRTKTKHSRAGLTHGKENRHVRHKSPIHHRKEGHDRAIADYKDRSPTRDSSCSSIESRERSSERISHQRPTRKHRHERTKRRASSSPESSYIPSKRRSRQSHHSTKCPLIKVLHSVAKETRLIAMETSENHSESSTLRQRLLNMGAMPAVREEAESSSKNDENGKIALDVAEESRSSSVNSSKPEDSCIKVLSESTQTDEVIEEITPPKKPDPEIVTLTDSEDGVNSTLSKTPNSIVATGSCNTADISNADLIINPPTPPENVLCDNPDDNDDDIGRLRLLALQSKKQEQQDSNPLDDGDVLQLRLAALKTAFMKKFKTRKKLPANTRTSKENSIFPLDDIPLPFSPTSPASPDEVITPVDMELAETDDEEGSLHSISRYSPSDPIPDCYSPSDDPYPVCYSPSDPTGSPILERSIEELLPPPPPPDFDLYFPDPTYESPLQGISIDNSYSGCYLDHIPSSDMCAPPPLPSYFREILSDPLYPTDVHDQSEDTTPIIQENAHVLAPDNNSVVMHPVDPIQHPENVIPSIQVGSQQILVEDFTDPSLIISEQKFQNECPVMPDPKESFIEEKTERLNDNLPTVSSEKLFMVEQDLDAGGNAEVTFKQTASTTQVNEEISLEEEEKLLRQRLLLNLAKKRAKTLTSDLNIALQVPTNTKTVLPDVVPNRSNLILLHPRESVSPAILNSNLEKSKSLEPREVPMVQSSKQRPLPLQVKASRPKSTTVVEASKSKSTLLGEPSETKSTQLMEPIKPKSSQLVKPVKQKSTQLVEPPKTKSKQQVVPSKPKSTQLVKPLKNKSPQLVEPLKLKSTQLIDSKQKPHQLAVSSQMSEDKRFIIHLGDDSDSNEDYSEAEALGRKCAKNKEKWILHLKELEANPATKSLSLSGSKLPLRNNLNPKQAIKERNPRKPFAENLADLENSVERFLKGVRSSHEAGVGSTSSSNGTPVAVKHLPASQQEEYRRLKQQIAQLEKQREISTRQQKQTLLGFSKSTQVAAKLNISKETVLYSKVPVLSTPKSSNTFLTSTNVKRDLLQSNVSVKANAPKQTITNTSIATQKSPVTILQPSSSKIIKLDNLNNLAPKSTATSVNCHGINTVKPDLSSAQLNSNLSAPGEVPQNKEGLLTLRSTMITERSHVLKELSSLAKLLAQVDKSLEAQSSTAAEVSSLIDKLCLAAGRWKAQNRTVATLVQKVALRQKVISSRNRSCVTATKACAALGNQLYGNSYRLPTDNADSMRLQLKQVHEKTRELAKRRTEEQARKRTLEKRAESCLIKLFSDTPMVDKTVRSSGSLPSSPSQISKEGKLVVPTQQTASPKSQEKVLSVSAGASTPVDTNSSSANILPHTNSIISRAVRYRLALNKVRSAKTRLNSVGKKRLLEKKRKESSVKQLSLATIQATQDSVFKDDLSDMDISTDGDEPGKKSKDITGNTDVVDMSVSPDTSMSPPVTERESDLDTNIKILEGCKNSSGTVRVNKLTTSKVMAKNVPQNQIISSAKTVSKSVLKNYVSPLGGISVFSNSKSETTKGNDLYAILCPYDLNGKCQDLECRYKHQHQ